ncbi:hypothetical protein [Streptomyces murinus]|uniref:hypothetical protein n=1 Tax=Streptomyces murinus TaxID=33900 RepID=UPI0036E4B8A8
MSDQLAKTKFADWRETDTDTWEAPFLRDASRRIRVTAKPAQGGGITLITHKRKTLSWRRAETDVTVTALHDQQALAVFEKANSMAVS